MDICDGWSKGVNRDGREEGEATYINPTATSSTLSRSAKSVKSSQAFWVRCLILDGRSVCCASSRRGIGGVFSRFVSKAKWMGSRRRKFFAYSRYSGQKT